MLILLPPSETKRTGGDGAPLDLTTLSFPALTPARNRAIAAVRALSRNLAVAAGMLHLGATSAGEAARNRVLTTSPTMPAIDRYDGVLFDALGAASLPPEARAFAGEHLAIGSALFGLTGALDPIPGYRLSHDSRLPGTTLGQIWKPVLASTLAAMPGLIVDLRSEGYAKLGPIPERPDAVYVRVLSVVGDGADGGGRIRALNHFNKQGKGTFTRRLLLAGIDHPDVGSLLAWAQVEGIRLTLGAAGELDLIV